VPKHPNRTDTLARLWRNFKREDRAAINGNFGLFAKSHNFAIYYHIFL